MSTALSPLELATSVANREATEWSDRFAFEVALSLEGSGEPLTDILTAHNFTKQDLTDFGNDPVFCKKVAGYREEISKNGLTFKLKAKAQAEILLDTSFRLIHDQDVSAAVKADLIKATVKWAGLEPKEGRNEGLGGGVAIQINLGPPLDPQTPNIPSIQTRVITNVNQEESNESVENEAPKN